MKKQGKASDNWVVPSMQTVLKGFPKRHSLTQKPILHTHHVITTRNKIQSTNEEKNFACYKQFTLEGKLIPDHSSLSFNDLKSSIYIPCYVFQGRSISNFAKSTSHVMRHSHSSIEPLRRRVDDNWARVYQISPFHSQIKQHIGRLHPLHAQESLQQRESMSHLSFHQQIDT